MSVELNHNPGDIHTKDWKLHVLHSPAPEQLNEEDEDKENGHPESKADHHGDCLILHIGMLQVLIITEETPVVGSERCASNHVDIEHGHRQDGHGEDLQAGLHPYLSLCW